MSQILASGKTGADKYDNRAIAPTKVLPRLDMRQIATSFKKLYEVCKGYSYSGVEGASEALSNDLSIITPSNILDYDEDLTQGIQTLIANGCRLDVDAASTVNNIILKAPKITSSNAPDGGNYTVETPLPFEFKDGLRFTFRATLTNTGAMQGIITDLVGMPSAVDILDETNSALVGGEIISGRFYKIVCATISTVKKLILIRSTAPVATQAEVNAGTNNTNFVTPLRLRNGFSMSLTTNGYIAFPSWLGGIIFQWGRNTIAGGVVNTAIALPIAYPTANLLAIGNAISNNVDEQASKAYPTNLSTITLVNGEFLIREIIWFSIGY